MKNKNISHIKFNIKTMKMDITYFQKDDSQHRIFIFLMYELFE